MFVIYSNYFKTYSWILELYKIEFGANKLTFNLQMKIKQ